MEVTYSSTNLNLDSTSSPPPPPPIASTSTSTLLNVDEMANKATATTTTAMTTNHHHPPSSSSLTRVLSTSRHLIRLGDNVMLRLPSTIIKTVKINTEGTISLGKYGSFKAFELIGKPYGPTYEILDDGKLKVVDRVVVEIEETEANNQEISSTGAQKLTFDDISTFRNEGLSGREIIAKQISEHSNFEKKTEYSKDKYMKRKEAKYLKHFTPIEPTVHNICEYNFEKLSSKIRELRPDTLSNMMSMANVRPGARLLVVEDVHGMVVSACVERMGGQGRIMVINDVDSPPDLHILDSFNFDPNDLNPISGLHWGMTELDWVPADLPLEISTEILTKPKNSRDIAKIKKRRSTFDKIEEIRQDYSKGEFDGVILATQYDPMSVLNRILPKIQGSAPIVVYSPFESQLTDLYQFMKSSPFYLPPTLTEPWLRQYQVLPGRTHPEMTGMGHGGFLLSTIRVFQNDEANSHKLKIKKKKENTGSRNEEENNNNKKREVMEVENGEEQEDENRRKI